MPFAWSDGTCEFCHEGLQTSCLHGGFFGNGELDGARRKRCAFRRRTERCSSLPVGADDALMPSLLTLSDVMGTGHHAAVAARVGPGKSVAVVGDGAVGLCGVIAAKRLGAEQIIMLGRHADRIALAREFGATDIVSERGDEAVERVRELTGGFGAHSVLECVGTGQAIAHGRQHRAPGRRHRPRRRAAVRDDPRLAADLLQATSRSAAAPRRCAPTWRSCCRTYSRAASSPAACSTAPSDLDGVPDGYRAMNDARVDQGDGAALTRPAAAAISSKSTRRASDRQARTMNIRMDIEGTAITATLLDTAAARDFASASSADPDIE